MHGIAERQMFIPPCLYPSTTPKLGDVEAKPVKRGHDKPVDLIRALKQEGYRNFFAIYGSNAFEYLVTRLWDQDKWVRIAAADALAGLADSRAYRYMVALLGDTDPDVRFAISVSLGKLGDARAIRPLLSACHDRNYFVRQGAGESLRRLAKINEATGWQRGSNNGGTYSADANRSGLRRIP